MTRTRRSAKQAGAAFERLIADYLADTLDERIDRRVKRGTSDRGDIGGVRAHGQRVVIECKNCATQSLPEWTREAHAECGNDGALVGVVVHKRRGSTDPALQWVAMEVRDLVALITGQGWGTE